MLIPLRKLASRPLGLAADAKPDQAGLYVTAFGTFRFNGNQWEELVSDKDTVVNRDGTPTCQVCKGTRRVRDKCDKCKGIRVVECEHCGNVTNCDECEGTGEGEWIECEDCK